MSTPYDLLIIRQTADFIAGNHLTAEQSQQVQQDWSDWGNKPIEEVGTWTIAFANLHGQFIEITNTRDIPRSATRTPARGHLTVIDGHQQHTINIAVEVSVTAPNLQRTAA